MVESNWREYATPQGRKYWHDHASKKSVWLKPAELKSERERLLDQTHWQEYSAEGGRVYWYNTETKKSTWRLPEEYKLLLKQADLDDVGRSAPASATQSDTQSDLGSGVGSSKTASTRFDIPVPIFETKELAEDAFIQLCRDVGLKSNWTWEEAMRKLIKYPMYKALNTPTERKEAFEKYISELRRKEREELRAQMNKLRDAFKAMLKSTEGIRFITTHSKIALLCKDQQAWKALKDEKERRDLIEDYLYELRKQDGEREREIQKAGQEKFSVLLKANNAINENTTWKEALELLEKTAEYQEDENVKIMEPIDRLIVFEDYVKEMERKINFKKRLEKEERFRQERKHRDVFKDLLNEMREDGRINVFSKWKDIYTEFSQDDRYLSILGQPGSTPMDMYRDLIVRIEDEVYPDRKLAQQILQEKGLSITPTTTFEQFVHMVKDDDRFRSKAKPINVQSVFLVLQDKVMEKYREEQRKSEKKRKRLAEDLKRLYRKAHSPAITAESEYSGAIIKQFHGRSAFEAADEATRKELFEYVVRRLKEKHEERERSSSRHRSSRTRHHEADSEDSDNERRSRKKAKHEEKKKREPDEEKEEGEASSSDDGYY